MRDHQDQETSECTKLDVSNGTPPMTSSSRSRNVLVCGALAITMVLAVFAVAMLQSPVKQHIPDVVVHAPSHLKINALDSSCTVQPFKYVVDCQLNNYVGQIKEFSITNVGGTEPRVFGILRNCEGMNDCNARCTPSSGLDCGVCAFISPAPGDSIKVRYPSADGKSTIIMLNHGTSAPCYFTSPDMGLAITASTTSGCTTKAPLAGDPAFVMECQIPKDYLGAVTDVKITNTAAQRIFHVMRNCEGLTDCANARCADGSCGSCGFGLPSTGKNFVVRMPRNKINKLMISNQDGATCYLSNLNAGDIYESGTSGCTQDFKGTPQPATFKVSCVPATYVGPLSETTIYNTGKDAHTYGIMRNCEGTSDCANSRCNDGSCGVCGYVSPDAGEKVILKYPKPTKDSQQNIFFTGPTSPCYVNSAPHGSQVAVTDAKCDMLPANPATQHFIECQLPASYRGSTTEISVASSHTTGRRIMAIMRNCEGPADCAAKCTGAAAEGCGMCGYSDVMPGESFVIRMPTASGTQKNSIFATFADGSCYLNDFVTGDGFTASATGTCSKQAGGGAPETHCVAQKQRTTIEVQGSASAFSSKQAAFLATLATTMGIDVTRLGVDGSTASGSNTKITVSISESQSGHTPIEALGILGASLKDGSLAKSLTSIGVTVASQDLAVISTPIAPPPSSGGSGSGASGGAPAGELWCQGESYSSAEMGSITIAHKGSSRSGFLMMWNCDGASWCTRVCGKDSAPKCGICGYTKVDGGSTLTVRFPKSATATHFFTLFRDGSIPLYLSDVKDGDVISSDPATSSVSGGGSSGGGSTALTPAPIPSSTMPSPAGSAAAKADFEIHCAKPTYRGATKEFVLTNTAAGNAGRVMKFMFNCEGGSDCTSARCSAADATCGECGFAAPKAGETVRVQFPYDGDKIGQGFMVSAGTDPTCYVSAPKHGAKVSYSATSCTTADPPAGTPTVVMGCQIPTDYIGPVTEVNVMNVNGPRVFSVMRNCESTSDCSSARCNGGACGLCGYVSPGLNEKLSIRFVEDELTKVIVTHTGGSTCYLDALVPGGVLLGGTQFSAANGGACNVNSNGTPRPTAAGSSKFYVDCQLDPNQGYKTVRLTNDEPGTVARPLGINRNCEGSTDCSSARCTGANARCGTCGFPALKFGDSVTVRIPASDDDATNLMLNQPTGNPCYVNLPASGTQVSVKSSGCTATAPPAGVSQSTMECQMPKPPVWGTVLTYTIRNTAGKDLIMSFMRNCEGLGDCTTRCVGSKDCGMCGFTQLKTGRVMSITHPAPYGDKTTLMVLFDSSSCYINAPGNYEVNGTGCKLVAK